ncbi:MAG TPA: hypothetical protein VFS53_03275 [Gemmatimonadota bacterium]|nr:hypothetical protein [Gemmatimonadota bacterium]
MSAARIAIPIVRARISIVFLLPPLGFALPSDPSYESFQERVSGRFDDSFTENEGP